jgi:nucleotide-binding universal stress UspA family protein
MTFRNLLVPTDFGAPARRALDIAIDLAGKYDAEITLLHAFMIPVTGYDQALVWPFEELEREAGRALETEVAQACDRYRRVRGALRTGVAWESILGFCKGHPVDLIVMGTSGRKGLAHALLGSVADKVVRLAPCPVLTTTARAAAAAPSP